MEDYALENLLGEEGREIVKWPLDPVSSATLSREIIEYIRRRETAYRMIEAMQTNVKMKRKVVQELKREQMAAICSVAVRDGRVIGDSMAIRDNTTAGCKVAAGSSMEERDSENIELLRLHVTEMMGGN